MDRPRVFISYAHKDAWDWAHRLYSNLELCIGRENLFWDAMIPPGPFPKHLENWIKTSDFFVAIMSPKATDNRGWCKKELEIAIEHERRILPVKFLDFVDTVLIKEGSDEEETFADFYENFDKGFRRLTKWLLGEPVSSWEYLGEEKETSVLLQYLHKGLIPGLVAKEIGDWAIVERLWPLIEADIMKPDIQRLFWVGSPQTPCGVFKELESIQQQIITLSASGKTRLDYDWLMNRTIPIVQEYTESDQAIKDVEHEKACLNTARLLKNIREFLSLEFASGLDAYKLQWLKAL